MQLLLPEGFSSLLVSATHNNAYFETRYHGKLAASLIMFNRPLPEVYTSLFTEDHNCWQERVDVNSRFKRLGLATQLLHFADEQLMKVGHRDELRYFVDLNRNGFMTYLAAQNLLLEDGNSYIFRLT